MKHLLFFLFLSISVTAQTNTEVYLFDLQKTDKGIKLANKKNISNNKEYDSQPFFYDTNTILFSSSRNGQTDIAQYNIKTGKKTFLNESKNGGEYSPQRIPNSKNISAVRLDNSGLQRFYEYDFNSGKSKELIRNLKVAYPFWVNERILVSSVIGAASLDLVISDLEHNTNFILQKNVGRSFHKIPNTNLISYISKKQKAWEIKSLNPNTLRTKSIVYTDGNFDDITWMPDGTILQAKKNQIVKFHPEKDSTWSVFATIEDSNIQNISRISVSPDGSKIAIVGEASASFLVDKQLEAYNNRDIEAFLKVFDTNVKVYDYPNKLKYIGNDAMRKRYTNFFKNTEDLNCKIVKRIEKDDMVIDEELVTANGAQFSAVAIYEIKNGKIVTVTFM